MDSADFLQTVHSHLSAMLADGELGMLAYAWTDMEEADGESGITLMAMDLGPEDCWAMALLRCQDKATRQLAFCLDRHGMPDQGTTIGDLVAGIYYEREAAQQYRPWIVEYAPKPAAPRVLWFNWANRFWNEVLHGELTATLVGLTEIINAEVEKREAAQ